MKKICLLTLIIVLLFSLISCNSSKKIEHIIDESEGKPLPDAVETFYSDENYYYTFANIMSQYIIVTYTDGTSENVKDALSNGNIGISDLDDYGIKYDTHKKAVN